MSTTATSSTTADPSGAATAIDEESLTGRDTTTQSDGVRQ